MADDPTLIKMRVMLQLQDEMNKRIDPDWITLGREWHRAIWIECGELMDHYGGWKWWKHSERNVDQVLLEIVDIWHFGLSSRISADRDFDAAAAELAADWNRPSESQGFLMDVEDMACVALVEEKFEASVIPLLLKQIDKSLDDLYSNYVGKNILNGFRQDHGYKDGSYQKQWNGREDNEHLSEITAALDANSASFRDDIYGALRERYKAAGGS